MYLAHMDTDKLARAEQAAAFLDSLGNFWPNDTRVQVAQLLAELRQELSDRKPAWIPEAVTGSTVDCKWPACKDDSGGCKDNYPCTTRNDRVAREIEDPEPVPAAAGMYRPGNLDPVAVDAVGVAFSDPLIRWVRAGQLIMRLKDFTVTGPDTAGCPQAASG